jgi:mRNA-degrading endonuclease toxin of MazEF toxin-antitoxin module
VKPGEPYRLVKRGEVYHVALDPVVGHEQEKTRRCVVVTRNVPDAYGAKNPMTMIVPLADANGRPGNVLHPLVPSGVGGTTKDSRVLCQQTRAVDKARIVGDKAGDLPSAIMAQVDAGLRALLDL